MVPSSAQAHRLGASQPSGTLTTTGTISLSSAAKAVKDKQDTISIAAMRIQNASHIRSANGLLLHVFSAIAAAQLFHLSTLDLHYQCEFRDGKQGESKPNYLLPIQGSSGNADKVPGPTFIVEPFSFMASLIATQWMIQKSPAWPNRTRQGNYLALIVGFDTM